MYDITPEMVREVYEERLQQAARKRLARRVMARHPNLASRLMVRVGNWLIATGARLQAQKQTAAAQTSQ